MHLKVQPISEGIAVGNAFVYRDVMTRDISSYTISRGDVKGEMQRLSSSLGTVKTQLEDIRKSTGSELGERDSQIFEAQRMVLDDSRLVSDFTEEMYTGLQNAEQVVRNVFSRYIGRFDDSPDEVLRSKADDLRDLLRMMLGSLLGIDLNVLERVPPNSIVVAGRLLPSDTVHLRKKRIAAIAVEEGSRHSHSAFLARSLHIPAVCGCNALVKHIKTNDILVVDALEGSLLVNPDSTTIHAYERRRAEHRKSTPGTLPADHSPAATRGGRSVKILANANNPYDVQRAAELGADGIGLYRLETFYLENSSLPDHEELAAYLSSALPPMREKPVTMRLIDIGGDKHLPYFPVTRGVSPFLGLRGVRVLLKHDELLRSQATAILSLTDRFAFRILVPMVSLPREITAVREIFITVAAEQGIESKRIPPIGAMVETPAAAIGIRKLIPECDFVSIGTNDLIQYTMAAGRENPEVAEYYEEGIQITMELIAGVSAVCSENNLECSICGEAANEVEHVQAFVERGIKSLSVSPHRIPHLKKVVREIA